MSDCIVEGNLQEPWAKTEIEELLLPLNFTK